MITSQHVRSRREMPDGAVSGACHPHLRRTTCRGARLHLDLESGLACSRVQGCYMTKTYHQRSSNTPTHTQTHPKTLHRLGYPCLQHSFFWPQRSSPSCYHSVSRAPARVSAFRHARGAKRAAPGSVRTDPAGGWAGAGVATSTTWLAFSAGSKLPHWVDCCTWGQHSLFSFH